MPFAILKNEKTVEQLVTRLFSSEKKLSEAAAKKAADALLKANPELAQIRRLPPGSLIVIPETAPPAAAGELAPDPAPALARAAARAGEALQALAAHFAVLDARAREGLEDIARLEGADSVRREGSAVLERLFAGTAKAAPPSLKDIDRRAKSRDESLAELRALIASLSAEKESHG